MNPTSKSLTFREFWPQYLRAHSSRASRISHFAGLFAGCALGAAMLACGMIFFLPLAAVPALIGARLGHRLEPRRDTASAEHPDLAILADLKMFGLFLVGRLGHELAKVKELPSGPALSTAC